MCLLPSNNGCSVQSTHMFIALDSRQARTIPFTGLFLILIHTRRAERQIGLHSAPLGCLVLLILRGLQGCNERQPQSWRQRHHQLLLRCHGACLAGSGWIGVASREICMLCHPTITATASLTDLLPLAAASSGTTFSRPRHRSPCLCMSKGASRTI